MPGGGQGFRTDKGVMGEEPLAYRPFRDKAECLRDVVCGRRGEGGCGAFPGGLLQSQDWKRSTSRAVRFGKVMFAQVRDDVVFSSRSHSACGDSSSIPWPRLTIGEILGAIGEHARGKVGKRDEGLLLIGKVEREPVLGGEAGCLPGRARGTIRMGSRIPERKIEHKHGPAVLFRRVRRLTILYWPCASFTCMISLALPGCKLGAQCHF